MSRGVGSVGPPGPASKLLLAALRRGSPWVLCFALFGAAAGSAGFCAVYQLGTAVTMAVERVLADGALPSLSVTRRRGVDAGQPALLQALPGVRAALARQTGSVQLLTADGRGHEATLFGVQLAQETMARPQRMRVEKRPVTATGPDRDQDLFLTRATAAALGLEPGAKVQVRGSGATLQLALRGVLADPPGATLGGAVAVTGLSVSGRLFGRSDLDQVEVLLDGDLQPEAAAPSMQATLGQDYDVAPMPARAAGAAGAAAVRVSVELAAFLALALATLALAAAAGDRVRAMAPELALQRALGVPPWWLALQTLLPSALTGAVAGFIGAVSGPPLASAFVPGLQAWLQAQTGTGVWLELPPARWLLVWGPLAGMLAGLAAAMWAARAAARAEAGTEIRAPAGAAARPALGGGRAVAGSLCLLGLAVLCWSGATRLGFAVRALDAALAVLGIALLAGPCAALLGAACARRGPIALLAAGRIRRTPGRALSALRVLAVALAVSLALLGVRSSVAAAAPELAGKRCDADLVVVRASALLGLPARPLDAGAVTASLSGWDSLARPPGPGPQGAFLLHLASGVEPAVAAAGVARRLGPLGDVAVLDGARLRASFLAAVQLALDAVAMLVWLLLGLAVAAAGAFLAADLAARGREAAALTAVGAGPLQRAGISAVAAALLLSAAALLAVPGGILIGASWTAGPLQHALGVRCAYVPPAELALPCLLAACALVLLLPGRSARRRVRLTAW